MNLHIYGIIGHRLVTIPLDDLDLDDLDAGEEFVFKDRVYEIRHLEEYADHIQLNVVLKMEL